MLEGNISRITLAFSPEQPEGTSICPLCEKFQFVRVTDRSSSEFVECDPRYELHQVYEDIYPFFPNMEKRATHGCTFCTFLRAILVLGCYKTNVQVGLEEEPVEIKLSATLYEDYEDGKVQSPVRAFINTNGTLFIELHGHRGKGTELRDCILEDFLYFHTSPEREHIPTETNPLSKTNVNMLKQWLHECNTEHSSCNAVSTGYSPTRLLAVKDEKLRIVEGGLDCPKYAALSYCWGRIAEQQRGFLTTTNNIQPRRSGFAMDELPRTLKDAIYTVRALGLDFTWIDSICICQDDAEEWGRELPAMAKIYSQAYVTIVAAQSESSFDGFLRNREPPHRASIGLAVTNTGLAASQTAICDPGTIHFRYPAPSDMQGLLSNSTWRRRGWTLQEELLSTRTLYFTEDIIYFECITSQKIENPEYVLPRHHKLPGLIRQPDQTAGREHYLLKWYQIIEQYSVRVLTDPKDKLPALEGLTAAFRALLDDVTIYGLWKSNLYRDLLWRHLPTLEDISEHLKHPRSGSRAPTWSWASRDGRVNWHWSILDPGWKSVIEDIRYIPHQQSVQCDQTQIAQLELVAQIASLKDVLVAFVLASGETSDPGNWVDGIDSWKIYAELGEFRFDHDVHLPVFSPDIQVVLLAENVVDGNIQAILIQPTADPKFFKRIGWFILNKPGELYSGGDIVNGSVFKSKKVVLV